MRAKTLNEFKQGGDPYNTLGIGYAAKTKAWFEKWAPGVKYKIKNSKTYVDEKLDLSYSEAPYLPDGLIIDGALDLYGCVNITSLPNNLIIKGSYLDARYTALSLDAHQSDPPGFILRNNPLFTFK